MPQNSYSTPPKYIHTFASTTPPPPLISLGHPIRIKHVLHCCWKENDLYHFLPDKSDIYIYERSQQKTKKNTFQVLCTGRDRCVWFSCWPCVTCVCMYSKCYPVLSVSAGDIIKKRWNRFENALNASNALNACGWYILICRERTSFWTHLK